MLPILIAAFSFLPLSMQRILFRHPVEIVLGARKRRVTIAACLTQRFRACYTGFSIEQEVNRM